MKYDIVLAGVGGQGILTVAEILAVTAVESGLNIKQSEVHGMAQRGGAVIAHLRLSDGVIWSDLVPPAAADLLLALEPMEALRHIRQLRSDGMLVANKTPVDNIPDYPPLDDIFAALKAGTGNMVLLNAEELAMKAGSKRTANVVLIGAAAPVLPLSAERLKATLRRRFETKGADVVNMNLRAFDLGLQAANRSAAAG